VEEIVREFKGHEIVKFPISSKSITGLSMIKTYIEKNRNIFVEEVES